MRYHIVVHVGPALLLCILVMGGCPLQGYNPSADLRIVAAFDRADPRADSPRFDQALSRLRANAPHIVAQLKLGLGQTNKQEKYYCGYLLGQVPTDQALSILINLGRSPRQDDRDAATAGLLQEAMVNTNQRARLRIRNAIGSMLAGHRKHGEYALVRVLAQLHDPECIDILSQELTRNTANNAVGKEAARALVAIGTAEATAALRREISLNRGDGSYITPLLESKPPPPGR